MEPNFTLDLTKAKIADTIPVMVKLNGANMGMGETALVLHYIMKCKIQLHLFSMDNDLVPKNNIVGGAKIPQLKIYKNNQVNFLAPWKSNY